jgi:ABC-2 type transport system ATP-binding protein
MEPLPLQVRNLTKTFNHRPLFAWPSSKAAAATPVRAVDAISMDVQRGEVYGVIGANGSGKSTLVRIVSTLLLPDTGEVSVFGADAVHSPTRVRPFLNRVSPDPSFFKNMSTVENLLFFGRIYGLSRGRVLERAPLILDRLGLDWEKSREPMSHLSRGQQQKVSIARSFLTSPSLMLLDEPTTGLDPRSKRDEQAFIQEISREHDTTILLTTHDMEEAELLCGRIAFLSRGAVVAEGTPLDLRRQVARDRPLETVSMDTVFMELTGQSIADDELPAEGETDA